MNSNHKKHAEYDNSVLALALRTWREKYDISSLAAAKILFTSDHDTKDFTKCDTDKNIRTKFQRRISYLEKERTAIRGTRLSLLMDQPGFLEVLTQLDDQNAASSTSNIVVTDEAFHERQQEFIENYNFKHDFWFINAAGIPMFHDQQSLLDSWIQNLDEGVSYNLIWDLSAAGQNPEIISIWNEQKKIFERDILPELNGPDHQNFGKIEIFGFRISHWDKTDISVNELCEDMQQWAEDLQDRFTENSEPQTLMIHPPFDLDESSMKPNLRYMLLKYNHAAGATLTYLPKSGQYRPTITQLECSNVTPPFGERMNILNENRVHVFFGRPHDVELQKFIREFEIWADRKYPRRINSKESLHERSQKPTLVSTN